MLAVIASSVRGSLVSARDQRAGGGAGGVGDFGAGEHAGDLLLAGLGGEGRDGGGGGAGAGGLGHAPLGVGAGGDLGAVGDHQHLAGGGQRLEPRAHRVGHCAAYALVHFDLWQGNILLEDNRISGLIDGERAFWGDPLAEMVSLALFDDIERDESFLAGYGEVDFDAASRWRLAAYRAYLYLIMLIETVPRGQTGPEYEQLTRLVIRHLTASVEAMAS